MMSVNVMIIGELDSPTIVETVPTVSALLSLLGLILLTRREPSTSMLSVLVVESAIETSESALVSMDMKAKLATEPPAQMTAPVTEHVNTSRICPSLPLGMIIPQINSMMTPRLSLMLSGITARLVDAFVTPLMAMLIAPRDFALMELMCLMSVTTFWSPPNTRFRAFASSPVLVSPL